MAYSAQLKVIVNARFLTQPTTGVQRFAIELCIRLKELMPNTLFVSPKNVIQQELAKQLGVVTFGNFTSHLWEQIELPIYLWKWSDAILLNLCNTAPLFYRKNIVCIHDIAFYVNPRWFSNSFVKLYKYIIPRLAKNSLKVITVSNFSKSSIINYANISESKVVVVYNGVADIFYNKNKSILVNELGDYILTVCSIDPRKNLVSLVRAYKRLKTENLKLVIIGAESSVFSDSKLEEEIKSCSGILFTGYLSDNELGAFYRNAKIFAYLSLYEGFGIPPLEAMASGVPTIVSNVTALPEICGNASLFVEPLNIPEIAEKIHLLANDEVLRQSLIEKGYKQIKQYSWDESAKQIALLLRQYL